MHVTIYKSIAIVTAYKSGTNTQCYCYDVVIGYTKVIKQRASNVRQFVRTLYYVADKMLI